MNGHTEAAHQGDDAHRPNYTLIKEAAVVFLEWMTNDLLVVVLSLLRFNFSDYRLPPMIN